MGATHKIAVREPDYNLHRSAFELVWAKSSPDILRIRVRDTGQGIHSSFSPFDQAGFVVSEILSGLQFRSADLERDRVAYPLWQRYLLEICENPIEHWDESANEGFDDVAEFRVRRVYVIDVRKCLSWTTLFRELEVGGDPSIQKGRSPFVAGRGKFVDGL